jgi:nucleotide-binding universal stress UspA family protein
MPQPLYHNVVAGYEETEGGEDARALAELIAERDGGELKVVHVEKGDPADVFRDMAERGEADLIVLGSTNRAAFGVVAPGSVAEHLLKGAPCRLIIAPKGFARAARAFLDGKADAGTADDVPAEEPPDEEPLPSLRDELRVVLVGFDGGLESYAALDEAAVLALRFGASLRVVTVATPAPPVAAPSADEPGQPYRDLQSRLHDAVAELPSEVRALPIYEKGDPVRKLLDRAGEGVDLLVLGSRGYGPLLRLIAGSVSVRVIRCAPCPVLLVPRPARDQVEEKVALS